MNKNFNFSVVAIAVSFLVSQQANAANTWAEARNDAMGGTGVASANYGSGVLINPALLAKAKPEDSVTVILPAVGAQITDKDNLQDEIDEISDKIDYYDEVVDNLTPQEVLLNPRGVLNQFQGAARDLADELEYLKGKTARASAGAGLAVSIPNETLSLAFVAKGYAHGRVSSSIDQGDIDYLRRIEGSDTYALVEAGKAAIEGSDEITKHLNSTASGRAAIVSDYGIAVARQFTFGDVPVSIGVTPKLQKPGSTITPPLSITTTVATGTVVVIVMMTLVLTSTPGLRRTLVNTGRWGSAGRTSFHAIWIPNRSLLPTA